MARPSVRRRFWEMNWAFGSAPARSVWQSRRAVRREYKEREFQTSSRAKEAAACSPPGNATRKILTVGLALATSAAAVIVTAAPAHASLACSGTNIRINGNPGAEAPSWATGHRHATGNHCVGAISGNIWYWYADNNGGSDGDTWDTYYGAIAC